MDNAQIKVCGLSELWRIERAAMGELFYIRRQIQAGVFEFFSIGGCYFVTTAEETASGRELVVVCAEGEGLPKAAQTLKVLAQEKNFKTVRIHAFRRGMRRLLNKLDFEQAETVYRLAL